MVSHKRRVSGKRAQSGGASFESSVYNGAIGQGWRVLRIPDGCRQLGAGKIIRVKSPFDFIIAKDVIAPPIPNITETRTILFDAKTTTENLFPPAKIKPGQLEWLQKFYGLNSYVAGYLVNFEKHGCVAFFTVPHLAKSVRERKGLAHSDGVLLGNKFNLSFEAAFYAKQLLALGDNT